jgi:ribosomal protein L32
VERIKVSGDGSLVFVSTANRSVYILNRNGQILLTYPFDGIVTGLDATGNGEYFIASAADAVYMFSIGRYLQYISREQVKILKMMEQDRLKGVKGEDGRKVITKHGAPDEPVNVCHRCGEKVLPGKIYCNYCDMMNRRGQ